MCYYHPEIDRTRVPASEVRFVAAVRTSAELLGLKVVVFSGKEPLLNAPRMFRLLDAFSRFREEKFSTGLVCNGRHLARHWPALCAAVERRQLDFLDISLDSANAAQHDTIRGVAGTFDLAWTALNRCSRELPGIRLGLSSVLRRDNAAGILALVKRAASVSRHFYIVPQITPVFAQTKAPAWSEISAFLESLRHLLTTHLANSRLEIMVSLLGIYLDNAARDGWIRWDEIAEDRNGSLYVDHEFAGNRVGLHLLPLPETAARIARITYAGDYLPNTHFLQDAAPERHAIGNIEREDVSTLYTRALDPDSIWRKIVDSRASHVCRDRPCWASCFGGWSIAEQNYLSDTPLEEQPRLCPKTEADFALN
jgi:hypothetical protein